MDPSSAETWVARMAVQLYIEMGLQQVQLDRDAIRDGTRTFDWEGRDINFQYIKVTYKNKISFKIIADWGIV